MTITFFGGDGLARYSAGWDSDPRRGLRSRSCSLWTSGSILPSSHKEVHVFASGRNCGWGGRGGGEATHLMVIKKIVRLARCQRMMYWFTRTSGAVFGQQEHLREENSFKNCLWEVGGNIDRLHVSVGSSRVKVHVDRPDKTAFCKRSISIAGINISA